MNIEERTEFEAFASKHGLCVTEDGDLYRSHVLAWMWKAWQARAALHTQERKDAERWRALREMDGGEIYALLGDCDGIHPELTDAAIDAAMRKEDSND